MAKKEIEQLRDEKCKDCGEMICECGSTMYEEKWMQGAVKKPGQLHRDLDVPQGEDLSMKLLARRKAELERKAYGAKTLSDSDKKLLQRIIFAINAKKLHEEIENFDSLKQDLIITFKDFLDNKPEYWKLVKRAHGDKRKVEQIFYSIPKQVLPLYLREYADTLSLDELFDIFNKVIEKGPKPKLDLVLEQEYVRGNTSGEYFADQGKFDDLRPSEKEEFINTVVDILKTKAEYWPKFRSMSGSAERIRNFFESLPARKLTAPEREYIGFLTDSGFLKLHGEVMDAYAEGQPVDQAAVALHLKN